jgi:hypothetical protein
MKRWALVLSVISLLAAAPSAGAAVKYGQAVMTRCDTGAATATFEGRVSAYRGATRAQLRFVLQTRTPDDPVWEPVDAAGFGVWITAPKVARYIYDKTVEKLAAPASYRVVIQFRWRNARGKTLHAERAITKACVEPDPRPDLVVKSLTADAHYVAVVGNSGRGDAGPFTVAFLRNGVQLGTVAVPGLAAGKQTSVLLDAPACSPGDLIAAQADSDDVVDEADEAGNVLSVTC